MLNGLPGLDLVFQSVDEVLLGQGLVLGLVDLVDKALLFNHLAGDNFVALGVDGKVGLREAPKTQHLVLDRVATVDHL